MTDPPTTVYVVVVSLFIVTPIICEDLSLVLVLIVSSVLYSFAIILLRTRNLVALL